MEQLELFPGAADVPPNHCGKMQTVGHGETLRCGRPDPYGDGELHMCDQCRLKFWKSAHEVQITAHKNRIEEQAQEIMRLQRELNLAYTYTATAAAEPPF